MNSKKNMTLGILTGLALTLVALPAFAKEGTNTGGGGDASEVRINDIRADILKWIGEGGAQALKFPQGITFESYHIGMEKVLAPHAVVVSFVTTAQEVLAPQLSKKVMVNGQPKTCRGFISEEDQLPHILCNTERFAEVPEAQQYQLVHHEYAGLAGIEQNRGASSDYEISSQITDYLIPQTVWKLAVKKVSRTEAKNGSIIECMDAGGKSVAMITHLPTQVSGVFGGYTIREVGVAYNEQRAAGQNIPKEQQNAYSYSFDTAVTVDSVDVTFAEAYETSAHLRGSLYLNLENPSQSSYSLWAKTSLKDKLFGITLQNDEGGAAVSGGPVSCQIRALPPR